MIRGAEYSGERETDLKKMTSFVYIFIHSNEKWEFDRSNELGFVGL